jgi:hypothetical protein
MAGGRPIIPLLLGFTACWGALSTSGAQTSSLDFAGCTGIQSKLSSTLIIQDSLRVDLGNLVLIMDGSTSARDSAYVVDLLNVVLPEMTEVFGAPIALTELFVELGGSASYYCGLNIIEMPRIYAAWQVDDDHDGRIDEDPFDGIDNDGDGNVDEDLPNAPSWDALFAHELAHAFQDDLLCNAYPRWFTEGMAEAAAWFVSEGLASRGGRHLLSSSSDLDLGLDDLLDHQGPQILGGSGRPIDRPSASMAYSAAAGTLLFPCLAEIAAGRGRPMARLTDALREDLPSLRFFETVDRVFLSPVDGMLPASRWMQRRAVVCPSVSNGIFLAITHPKLPVNADRIGVMYFSRQGFSTEFLRITGFPTYTGVSGEKVQATRVIAVPELAPGAYRVDQRELGANGSSVSAKSWILIVHDHIEPARESTRVAVVFVNEVGNPVDVQGLSVDGTMIERVPGGCVVEPVEGAGSVTFRNATGVIGTVLLVPSHLRMVVLPAKTELPRGAVSWSPYHPRPGGHLVACLRTGISTLASDPGPIHALLQGTPSIRQEAEAIWSGPEDLVYARFSIPMDLQFGTVSFLGSASQHHSPANGLSVQRNAEPGLIAAHIQDAWLVLEFDEPADPSGFVLELADDPAGPWISSGTNASTDSGTQLHWPLPSATQGRLARVRDLGASGDGVLCTVRLEGEPAAAHHIAYAPFPNPSDVGTLWRVDLAASAEAVFEVFDVAGRRVHGPEHLRLEAGRNELWWDGHTQSQRTSAGMYFLKVTSPAFEFKTRVVILPR